MITINLLPYELRPIKRTPLPYILSGFTLLMALGVIGLVFIKNMSDIGNANETLNQHRAELTDLQPIVEEYNGLTQKKLTLAEQVSTIDEIASGRMIWSRQLFNLNRLCLENMWYESIEVSTQAFPETRLVYNEQTKEQELKTESVPHQVLILKGYVIAGEDGQSATSPFLIASESDQEFSDVFALESQSFKDIELDEEEVREFEFMYIVGQGSSNDD